tara:strand:+ start:29 stop:1117 length:1089 start_codon:yes stop_codon:yes gene_type:complete
MPLPTVEEMLAAYKTGGPITAKQAVGMEPFSSEPAATNPEKNAYIANKAKPTNLYEYYTGQGQNLPSVDIRRDTYGLGADYTGTGPQNEALLSRIMADNTGSSIDAGGQEGPPGSYTTPSGVQVDGAGNVIGGVPKKTDADLAYDSYLASLAPSADLTSARKGLREHDTQAALDYEKALESGSTLGFARGEAGLTQRQNAIMRAGQAATVQAYADLDANRQNISKSRYEYEKAKIDAEAEKNKTFTLGENQTEWQYNPETKKHEQIAAGKTNELDDAYRQAQIDKIYQDIADNKDKVEDDKNYTIKPAIRNELLGLAGWGPEDVDALQEAIRIYGKKAVIANQSNPLVIQQILDKQGLTYLQ